MYNKLFTSILDSSIWLQPSPTRIVWVTFLAAMDEDGFVRMATVTNLANRAYVTIGEAAAAVATLEGPDEASPGQAYDGRRIERVEGGWMVLNAAKYRDTVTRAHEREQTRLRVAKHRAKQKVGNGSNAQSNTSEADQDQIRQDATHTQAQSPPPALPISEAAREQAATRTQSVPRNVEEVIAKAAMAGGTEAQARAFWDHFEACGWIDRHGHAVQKWQNRLAKWIADDRGKSAETAHHAGPARSAGVSESAKLVLAEKELTRVEKEIARIQGNYEAHQDVDILDRAVLSKLKKRRTELKEQLGFKA